MKPNSASSRALALLVFISLTLAISALGAATCTAQSSPGDWAWMGGCKGCAKTYGTEYQFAANNYPGDRGSPATWTDAQGRLWLFSGTSSPRWSTDLWAFDPVLGAHGEWAWMGGTQTEDNGAYGTEFQFSDNNWPGERAGAAHWTDINGRFWMFGGMGHDSIGIWGLLNDLWVFDPALGAHGQWAWMGGPKQISSNSGCLYITSCGAAAVYGTEYQFAPDNVPGGRTLFMSWTDGSGRFWMFGGGFGADSTGNTSTLLHDLWVFDPVQGAHGQWAWMGGDQGSPQRAAGAIHGIASQFAPDYFPAWLENPGVAWVDKGGDLWFYSGYGDTEVVNGAMMPDLTIAGYFGMLGDLWAFDPRQGAHGEWAWMGSQVVPRMSGDYGPVFTFSPDNFPPGRFSALSWTDKSGKLWMFGGSYDDSVWHFYDSAWLSDLWGFDPERGTNGEWAWMGGSPNVSSNGVYGTEYQPGAANLPPSRGYTTSWTDVDGNFWLFGADELWKFQPLPLQTISFAALPSEVSYGVAPMTLSATASSSLPVTFSVLSGPGNISGADGSTLKITGGGTVVVAAYQSGNGQYGAAQVQQSILVDKAPLKVQATSLTMPYGGTVPALIWTATGFVKGDSITNSLTGAPELTTRATSTSLRGTYPIKITAGTQTSTKYAPQYVDGTLTVQGTPQTISFPALPQPLTYGAAPITLSATASSGLPVTYKMIAGPGQLSGNTLTITGGAAAVVVNAYQAGDSEYERAPVATQSRWVFRAPLTVTADNKTMTYGQPVPALTWTVTGFVNGETASVLTGAPALSTIATSTTPPGAYAIKVAGNTLSAANYAISPRWGTLTIQPLGTVATPAFSPAGGIFTGARTVRMSDTTGGSIMYTTDGSIPSLTHGTQYTGPITVSTSETLKAIGVKKGYTPSAVASATYTIQ